MKTFFYVYILQSESDLPHYYTGFTEDLKDRLAHHNSGKVPATAPFRPWQFKTCISFLNRERALAFERYLKTHSGRAFAIKHL
jgi:predicted GIY-YIG superfamily endonuclease